MQGLTRTNSDLQFVMVMDRSGNAIVATDPEVMGKNFKFREYFKQAMEGHSYMTGIIVGSVAGAAGVFFSRPVFAPDSDTVIGAVVMRVKAEPVARILDAARVDEERVPFLVDGDGVIVWHPDEPLPLQEPRAAQEGSARRDRCRPTLPPFPDRHDQPARAGRGDDEYGDRGHIEYHSRIMKRDEIAGYAPVPLNDWVVGVSESRDYFAAPLARLFQKVILSVVLAGGIFVALALIFARSIVRPIQALTESANALKNGDYENANIEVRSADEVGQLARTFNVMIDVLRQRERERERSGARRARRLRQGTLAFFRGHQPHRRLGLGIVAQLCVQHCPRARLRTAMSHSWMNQFWLRSESTGVWPVSGTCITLTRGFSSIRLMVGGSSASDIIPWIRNTGQRTRFHRLHWSRLSWASSR